MDSPDFMTPQNAPLRRMNSIATAVIVPAKLTLPAKALHPASFPSGTATIAASGSSSTTTASSSSQSFPAVDLELISIKPPSYTSLKDLLPSTAVQSPTGGQSGHEISIRNRLVKQAAWAYLQPMSTSLDSSGRRCLPGLWSKLSGNLLNNPLSSLFRFISRTMILVFDQFLRVIRAWGFRYW